MRVPRRSWCGISSFGLRHFVFGAGILARAPLLKLKVVPSVETVCPSASGGSSTTPMPHDLPKAYDPTAIEDHWAEYWVRENLFAQPTPAADSQEEGEPFTILLPPPNV